MKLVGLLLTLGMTMNANAWNMLLLCKSGETPDSCGQKVEQALSNLNCHLNPAETVCEYYQAPDQSDPKNPGAHEKGTPYCKISSSNCSEPRLGNFGGESCDEKKKVSIPRSAGVHHNYWFGPFGSYSRTICRDH